MPQKSKITKKRLFVPNFAASLGAGRTFTEKEVESEFTNHTEPPMNRIAFGYDVLEMLHYEWPNPDLWRTIIDMQDLLNLITLEINQRNQCQQSIEPLSMLMIAEDEASGE